MEIGNRTQRMSREIAMNRVKGQGEPDYVGRVREKIKALAGWDAMSDEQKLQTVEQMLKDEGL